MTCHTVSHGEMSIDMDRYFPIVSNIAKYCLILPDILQSYQILSFIVQYCFKSSDVIKNVNKCSIFGIMTSQYS